MKKNIILLLFLAVVPYLLCVIFSLFSDKIRVGQGGNQLEHKLMGRDVLIEINGLYKTMDVEQYIAGVLPGTISSDYDEEALKVQAILIRTNVLKEMEEKGTSDAADLSYDYLTIDERISLFGERNYERIQEKYEQAVADTAGTVLCQENSFIMALYHEVSIGKTVSAKEVLGKDIAYLQSVDSSQDVEAKNYMNMVNYTWAELQEIENAGVVATGEEQALTEDIEGTPVEGENSVTRDTEGKIGENKDSVLEATEGNHQGAEMEIEITESTENGFVKKLLVNGNIYTGEEAMKRYKLSSTNFYVEKVEGGIRFMCLGTGSCLGLSQYGANSMALNGATAEEIIQYYYTKVSIEQVVR